MLRRTHSASILRHTTLASVGLIIGCQDPVGQPPLEPGTGATAAATSLAPIPPSNTSAVAVSQTQINVGWKDNSQNESRFEVYRSSTGATGTFTLLVTPAANVIAFNDQGLVPASQYCYRVRAARLVGRTTYYSAFSNTACATTFDLPPAAAANAYVVLLDSVSVSFFWTDQSSNENGFRIYRSSDGGAVWNLFVTVGANTNSWSGTDPLAERGVCYRVVAFNAVGEATPGSTCPIPPAQPTNLTVTGVGVDSLELTWRDNSAVEDVYEVRSFYSWSPCPPGGGTCDQVIYTWDILLAELPANTTSYRTIGGETMPPTCAGFIECGFTIVARRAGP